MQNKLACKLMLVTISPHGAGGDSDMESSDNDELIWDQDQGFEGQFTLNLGMEIE